MCSKVPVIYGSVSHWHWILVGSSGMRTLSSRNRPSGAPMENWSQLTWFGDRSIRIHESCSMMTLLSRNRPGVASQWRINQNWHDSVTDRSEFTNPVRWWRYYRRLNGQSIKVDIAQWQIDQNLQTVFDDNTTPRNRSRWYSNGKSSRIDMIRWQIDQNWPILLDDDVITRNRPWREKIRIDMTSW